MGLSARRPQLPSLNLPSARSSERKDILIEQFDFDDERLEDTTEIVLDSHRAFRPDPSTPVTPLPGTPLVFDEAPSHRSGTPVTPGFANGPNPFSFSFSQRSPSSSSHTPSSSPLLQPSKGISSALAEGHLAKGVAMAENSPGIGLHPSGLGLIPSFGTLNGLSTLKKGRGSNPSGGTRQNDKDASHEEVPWNDRELETLESFLLNPLRPLSTTYPPGTLPPPAALDELTSQIIHFHRPTPTSLPIDDLHSGSPKQGGIASSRSAPSLKVDASASHYVGKGRHRRTHSSSGVVWKHSWPSTRQKLYEVARKEALGDSREDRFKGRLDIKKRALFTGSDMDPGPISPMPENMSDGLSFDFASQRDVPGTMIRSRIPGHIGTSQTGCYDGQDFTTKTTSKWSADSNITTSSVGPTIRPISLLQRGKSFTAEDFDAAMTLDESVKEKSWTSLKHPSTDLVQLPQCPTSTVNTTPPPIFALPRGRVSGSSPLSSEGPKTPEAPPGITLTSPSPCGRHRNEQMRGMGSPIPGSDDRPGAFGGLLDFAASTADKPDAPRRKNRPSPLMRSRSTWDESQTHSMVAQFIQGPPLFQTTEHDLDRSQPFRLSEHRTDASSQGQTPFAKRQKVQGTETNLEE